MDDVYLQILPGPSGSQIAITSRGARVGGVPATPLPLPQTPPADGPALWRALPEPARRSLAELHALAVEAPVPLWLDVQVPELAGWPWELLAPADRADTLPFSLLPQAPLVRYAAAGRAPAARPGTLRVLALAASPRDLHPLDAGPLLALLDRLRDPNRIDVMVQPNCTPDTLREALARQRPDLLLALAHGEPGAMLLEDRNRDSVPLATGELAALIAGTPVRAVVLASCDGATPAGAERSTAEALLVAGALGVVAMRGPISTDGAVAFLDGLLGGIAAGQALEVAVVAGRQAILTRQGMAGEWAVPVCWQRALHRPLVLPPQEAVRRGASTLAQRAPQWAKPLAAGGMLGLLAVASVQPLLAPLLAGGAATIAMPAVIELLKDLGLNVFAGYLGNTLGRVWQATGGGPTAATSDEIAQALQVIAGQHDDAAAQLADLARANQALAPIVEAIRQETDGSRALLAGLDYDLRRHGATLDGLGAYLRVELVGLRDDLRQGFGAIFWQGERIEGKIDAVYVTATRIEAKVDDLHNAGERARHMQQALLDGYLRAMIVRYEQVTLSRFIDLKKGSGESVVTEPYLQEVYVALTTDGPPGTIRLRRDVYPARVVRRALRLFRRAGGDQVVPDRVRLFAYQSPDPRGRGRAQARDADDLLASLLDASDGTEWVSADLPDDLADDTMLRVRLRRPELVIEALAPRAGGRQPRLVLLGDPGSGKSTVLRYMAVLLAQALRAGRPPDLRGWPEGRIPLLLPLGTLAKHMRDDRDDRAALQAGLAELLEGGESNGPRSGLAALLPELWPHAILLLDGLDELSATTGADDMRSPRSRAAQAIRALAHELPETPIVVTCRVLPYRALAPRFGAQGWSLPSGEGWQERKVQPFAFGQVRQFVSGWYRASMRDGNLADQRAGELLRELEASPALRLAIAPAGLSQASDPPASPLLLTMLTILHFNSDGRPLPPERDELYEKLVDLLLQRWEPKRSEPAYQRDDLLARLNITGLKGSAEPLRRVLHQVAYEAHRNAERGGDGRGVIDAELLHGRFTIYFRTMLECSAAEAGEKVEIFIEALRDEAGLLMRLGDNAYALPHLTFQEYLAGCYFADRPDPAQEAYEHWRGQDYDRWREPLLLMCGRLRQTGNAPREGVRWIERLCRPKYAVADDELRAKDAVQRQRDALLAAECYEVLGRRTRIDLDQAEEIETRLCEALLTTIPPPDPLHPPELHLTPPERARAGLLLARLGDPRPGVCALPRGLDDPYWCGPFPEGKYPIADGKARVRLREFRIARYPVTVWQFQQFWEDPTGYENKAHWPKQGWEWKNQGQVTTQPWLWDEPDWTADNQPVVGVSWYEAAAFCRWLTERGRAEGWLGEGLEIRLPSQAEWEVAAMWDAQAQQMRPWRPPEGELWQNVEEAGIGCTSPVGIFSQGASPCGALDMAGNTWEWCSSSYRAYRSRGAEVYDDFASGDLDVPLRGGVYYLQNARSGWGVRLGDDPYARDNRGFRVVVCSAPPV